MPRILIYIIVLMIITSCSQTSSLEPGDVLYTGMKATQYNTPKTDGSKEADHYLETQEEIEAAIACEPNGAFFGSSYHRTIPYALWIYNAFDSKESDRGVGKWVQKTFGKAPVLMSEVNPELRVSVAENVLQNRGYFRGNVDYEVINGKNTTTRHDSISRPHTAKLKYTVNTGPLFTVDSISYTGFTEQEDSIIHSSPSLIRKGAPFSVADLDAERMRVYYAFKDNGYYYFQQSYLTYLADTVRTPGRVCLQLCKVDSLPEEAGKPWVIGKTIIRLRREMMEKPNDTLSWRRFTVEYANRPKKTDDGKTTITRENWKKTFRPPLRPRVLLQDMQIFPGSLFSQAKLRESLSRLTTKGIFSSVDINMTQRSDSLDMLIDCVLDKPYDFTVMANYTHKTSGRGGPGVGMSFAKRNAFRGAELLSFNINANADFAVGNTPGGSATNYDITADVSLEMPRLLLPAFLKKRRRWYIPPTTLTRVSFQTINRTGFFMRNILSAELLYNFQPTEKNRHTFSPLTIDYSYVGKMQEAYKELIAKSVYMQVANKNLLIPKMRYSYTYMSKDGERNPMSLTLTVTEAGAFTNLCKTIGGGGWNEKEKKLFRTSFSQYLKVEAEWRKAWMTSPYNKVVAHAFAGYVHPYGNSTYTPFSERYYMGGANDLRGFSTRAVGPGSSYYDNKDAMYLLANGNLKLLASLEYRPRLFGSLYGALFDDAGNVWDVKSRTERSGISEDVSFDASNMQETGMYAENGVFRLRRFANDIAVSAGVGIRYDLDFFVIRLDWGFIVHAPYDTGRSGYFNIPSFSKGQCLNFAIGYPF